MAKSVKAGKATRATTTKAVTPRAKTPSPKPTRTKASAELPATPTMRAVRIHQTGGPEALTVDTVPVPTPGDGEVLIRQSAIGVNFIDIYHRQGAYPLPSLPHGIGMEGAGVVEVVGKGVTTLKPGDRVAYAFGPPGSYAEMRVLEAFKLVKLPKEISDKTGAAMMLQGMTARYLLKETYKVKKGDVVLVHAAAGGMGLILCQWAKALGAIVIGTTSSEEKAKLAKKNGCHHPIIYTKEDFVARVKEITNGQGVQVVYDGVGKDTFMKSLDCLAMRGMLVNYGSASGAPDPFAPGALSAKSAFLTRPTLFHYIAKPEELAANARDLFKVVKDGTVKIAKPIEYKLAEAGKAHADLAARKTTGSIILIP